MNPTIARLQDQIATGLENAGRGTAARNVFEFAERALESLRSHMAQPCDKRVLEQRAGLDSEVDCGECLPCLAAHVIGEGK